MKTIKTLAAVATLTATSAWADLAPVISVDELAELRDSVKVLEIQRTPEDVAKARIDGAVYLPYGTFRGPKNNPGALPKLTELAQALGSKGLLADDPIVIVHAGETSTDFGAAARVYWTLKSVGYDDLSILNGGYKSYVAAKQPITADAPAVSPVALELSFNDQWYASTAAIESDSTARLLDSRLDAFYQGKAWHGAAKRPGILPGADHFAFDAFFDKDSALLKSADAVRGIVESNGLSVANTVSYCNTGHWAATNWFVLSELAEVDQVKLYAESMVEWSNLDKPMDNVPGALEFAWLKTRNFVKGLAN